MASPAQAACATCKRLKESLQDARRIYILATTDMDQWTVEEFQEMFAAAERARDVFRKAQRDLHEHSRSHELDC